MNRVKLMAEQASGYYARALRAIGQDLADLVPETLTVEIHGDRFVASGTCAKSRMEEQTAATSLKNLAGKFFKTLFQTPRSGEPELEFVPFHRTYNSQDIERLDALGTQRRNRTGMPDIYTLGERLRTIGKVIDAHNGRAVRIVKDLHQVVFEYQDSSGAVHKEALNNTELYQLQQRHALERSAADAD
ncbi:MAG TPA: hypothetical protein VNN13_02970 [Methylomirabilota bacterium]|nr:hypothetical protein [Methylomirabilota bacterium]